MTGWYWECVNSRGSGGTPCPQVLPGRSDPHGVARGQVAAGSVRVLAWTLALRALAPWVPDACLYAEAYFCSPPLCSLDLKVSHRQRAGSAQLGYRCPAIPQTADSATLTSGSKWLVSPSRSPLVSPTRARESFLKCLLPRPWAQLCPPTPIHMLIFEPPAP